MSIEAIIREKLTKAFAPTRLDVINESHLHAGHRGSPGTGESHFRVLVVSAAFAGASRVARHRAVNKLLEKEGTETSGSKSPEDFAAFIAEDAKLWARLVKESGAKAD